ncbi:MAG: hypothetical protein U0800_22990 [Isosphaeraceae bacterium]
MGQDLAGVPKMHRHLDLHRAMGGSKEERLALVESQLAELQGRIADPEVTRRDAIERQQTIEGRGMHLDPTLIA